MANMEHMNMTCGKDLNAGPGRKGLSIQLHTQTLTSRHIAHYSVSHCLEQKAKMVVGVTLHR